MKVLHFFKTYQPETFGGIEQVIFELAEGTRTYGVKSHVLTLTRGQPTSNEVYAHHLVDRAPLNFEVASTGFSFQSIKCFRKLIKEVDVVHYHFPWPFMDLTHLLVHPKLPTVVTYHSDVVKQKWLNHLYLPLMRRFLNQVDAIVATSPQYVQSSQVLQHYQEKVSVIPIGLNESASSINPMIHSKWPNLPPTFFLFVGALRYYKGLHYLLHALAGKHLPTVIAGSGPMETELKQQAENLGLKNIYFLGAVSEAEKYWLLKRCLAFVFPSHLRSEAFGIAPLEAAIQAKPIISCDIRTGTTYVNQNQVTGLVVPPANPKALEQAMLKLWDDRQLAESLGENAQSRFRKMFTAEAMCRSYNVLYQKIYEKHHKLRF